jgi:hypothetical protein
LQEIPIALERHRANKARVVPVILKPCQWKETPLKPLNVLPDKALALTEWRSREKAWNSVADGLITLCRELMAAGGRALE